MKTLDNSIAVLNGSKVEFVNEMHFEQTASMKKLLYSESLNWSMSCRNGSQVPKG